MHLLRTDLNQFAKRHDGERSLGGLQQISDRLVIDLGERLEIFDRNALIDLMNGRVWWAKFNDLTAVLGDKTSV
jgi:hypothetical protein